MSGASATRELNALSAATQRLSSMTDRRKIYQTAVQSARTILSAETAGMWIVESEPDRLRLVAQTEPTADVFEPVVPAGSDDPVWAAFHGEAVSIGSTSSSNASDASGQSADADTIVAFPLDGYGTLAVRIANSTPFAESLSDSPGEDSSTAVDRPRVIQHGRILAAAVTNAVARSDHEHALRVQREQLSEFVGFVSHDLKNPLNIASGHLEIARTACDGPVETFETIETALSRMNTLVEDLLKLAKQGELVTDRSTVSLKHVAEQAWRGVHAPNATLVLEGDIELSCDADRLAQALENLFRNSVEHGSTDNRADPGDAIEHAEGPIRIRVGPIEPIETATRSATLTGPVGFYVADDGPGIPDDAYEDVLSEGYSTRDSTGIGLTIVQRIVEAHGWTISASRSADGGARFDITDGSKPVAVPSTEPAAEE